MDKKELERILAEHKRWIETGYIEGSRADLRGADLWRTNLQYADLQYADLWNADLQYANLRGADLRNADLWNADLQYADLQDANLRGADLRNADLWNADLQYANLRGADLRNADLRNADLRNADLQYADLQYANLQDANLRGANLCVANLQYANLRGADLRGADLRGADLRNADLRNADLRGAKNVPFVPYSCPDVGAFIGYKRAWVRKDPQTPAIVELEIMADARRCSTTGRKCRCDKAKVLSITSPDVKEHYESAFSDYDASFIYKVGEIVEVKDFDENRWNECSTGIHFFINRQEAVDYGEMKQ